MSPLWAAMDFIYDQSCKSPSLIHLLQFGHEAFTLCQFFWSHIQQLQGRILIYHGILNLKCQNVKEYLGVKSRKNLSQRMKLWYLSHRRPLMAQTSLHIHTVSPEPSMFAHIKYGSRRGPTKNQTSSPTGWLHIRVWKWVYGGQKVP